MQMLRSDRIAPRHHGFVNSRKGQIKDRARAAEIRNGLAAASKSRPFLAVLALPAISAVLALFAVLAVSESSWVYFPLTAKITSL
jgi:hypothetical protein